MHWASWSRSAVPTVAAHADYAFYCTLAHLTNQFPLPPLPVKNKKKQMSMVMPESFQHILRVMNTNLKGERKIMFSLTAIKGVGRRYANLCCKMAEINLDKRAGELVRLFSEN